MEYEGHAFACPFFATVGKEKIPSPGGRVAPKGSGEECGRQGWITGNPKTYSVPQ